MLAYVLLACFAIPLVMLIVDVMAPRRGDAPGVPKLHQDANRPHVTAATVERRDVHRAPAAEEPAPRPPRIAPGDGMVYRPAQPPARPR